MFKKVLLVFLVSVIMFFGCKRSESAPKSTSKPNDNQSVKSDGSAKNTDSKRVTLENISEAELAMVKADIEDFRKRYATDISHQELILDSFGHLYLSDKKKYSNVARDLLDQLAEQGDLFALDSYIFRTRYDKAGFGTIELQNQAAEAGAPEAMQAVGWLIGTGFNDLKQDKAKGEIYLKKSADMGSIVGNIVLITFYHRYGETDKMCEAARKAYERYGLEVFSKEIVIDHKFMHDIQSQCKTFSDKEYTLFQMEYDWLNDFDTAEARYLQGTIQAKREPVLAKLIFEELEKGDDMRFVANAQYCLGMMYYYGVGVQKNKLTASEYKRKAFANGNLRSTTHDLWQYIEIPKQRILTDYHSFSCFRE